MSRHPNPTRPKDNRPPKRDPKPPFDKKQAPKKYALPPEAIAAAREVALSLPPPNAKQQTVVRTLLMPGIEARRREKAA